MKSIKYSLLVCVLLIFFHSPLVFADTGASKASQIILQKECIKQVQLEFRKSITLTKILKPSSKNKQYEKYRHALKEIQDKRIQARKRCMLQELN